MKQEVSGKPPVLLLGALDPETPATRIVTEVVANGEDRDLTCRKDLFRTYDTLGLSPTTAMDEGEEKKSGKGRRKVAKGLRTFWTKEEDERYATIMFHITHNPLARAHTPT